MNSTEINYSRRGSLGCSIAMIPTAVFGIAGNFASACVFSHQRRLVQSPLSSPSPFLSSIKSRSSINLLLISLTLIDTLLLILATPLFSTIAFYNFDPDTNRYLLKSIAYMTVYAYPLSMMAQCASAWTILVISLERYTAVCRPLLNREFSNVKKTKITLTIVILGAVVYNACRFGEYRLNEYLNSTTPLLRDDRAYVDVYINWSYFVLVFALPFFVLLIVNSLIAKTIFHAQRQRRVMLLTQRNLREHRTALMMAAVVLAYICCNVLALVLNAWEAVTYLDDDTNISRLVDTDLFRFLSDFNNLLIQTHSGLTFVVYFRFSGHFRTYVRQRCRIFFSCSAIDCLSNRFNVRSRSVSLLAAVRKYSSDFANRYRRSWSSIGSGASVISTTSDSRIVGQNQRVVQLVFQEKSALGLKRKTFAINSNRTSLDSQLDPFYV